MIRTSKHNISDITNSSKLKALDTLFIDYKNDLSIYIGYIIDGILPLKTNLSSKLLPTENIIHSRFKQLIYKHASEIIKSQYKQASNRRYHKYKYIYNYYIKHKPNSKFVNTKFSELKLNNIYQTKFFKTPNLKNISINLDERFFDIKDGIHFDNFVKIILPSFNIKGTRALQIMIPFKHHKHSNELRCSGFSLRRNIQLKYVNNQYYINLVWEKPDVKKREYGDTIGIDLGYNKLIVTSENDYIGTDITKIYNKISHKKQGSKAFKRALNERDNMINSSINKMNIKNIKKIVIENLNGVKTGKKYFNNKTQRWSYKKTINKILRMCEVNGIDVEKVSPLYTSQTCSKCGNIDKLSRNGEKYKCIACLYEIDADYNASINIRNRGEYSLSMQKS